MSKAYVISSVDAAERYTVRQTHGIFDDLELAKSMLPVLWKQMGWQGGPNHKEDMVWIQYWGDGTSSLLGSKENNSNGMPGYVLRIEEKEINKLWQ